MKEKRGLRRITRITYPSINASLRKHVTDKRRSTIKSAVWFAHVGIVIIGPEAESQWQMTFDHERDTHVAGRSCGDPNSTDWFGSWPEPRNFYHFGWSCQRGDRWELRRSCRVRLGRDFFISRGFLQIFNGANGAGRDPWFSAHHVDASEVEVP